MSFWTDKKVFITGHKGLIGTPLVRLLEEKGAEVHGYDVADSSDENLDNTELLRHCFTTVQPDVIIHLAAISGVEQARSLQNNTLEVNVKGTWNVLNTALGCGSYPVVVASSNHVYGPQLTLPVDEKAPLNQLDTYSVSKICADYITRAYSHNYGLPTVVVRNTNCFGPADPHHDHLIPGTILSILRGETPILQSHGTTKKGYLYVDDVAEAYMSAAQFLIENKESTVFNVGANPVSAIEVVNQISTLMGYGGGVTIREEHNDQTDEDLDWSNFYIRTRWHPRHTLTEALEKTIDWFTANHKVEAIV
jgi:CDP-glucose 4,6-dehydratase